MCRVRVGGGDALLKLPVEELLAHRQCHARFGQNTVDQLGHGRVQRVGLGNPVHQPLALRLLRADERSRHQHLERRLASQVARQRHPRGRAEQSQIHAAHRKTRAAGSDR